MGIHRFPAKMLGELPTFYVTDVIEEDAGGGNVRVWNFTRRKGVIVPIFEAIVPATNLVVIGRKVADFSQNVFNDLQMRGPGMKVH